MVIETKILHKIWQSVEVLNPDTLIELSNKEIVESLIEQVKNALPLSSEDTKNICIYVEQRTPLIRELVYSKLSISS